MKVFVMTKAIEETYIGDENNDGDEIDEGDGDEGEKGGQDNEGGVLEVSGPKHEEICSTAQLFSSGKQLRVYA